MDGNHPKDIDPRPKRRRAKDNPYEIYTVGIHTDQPHYFIAFTDYGGVHHEIEIDKAPFKRSTGLSWTTFLFRARWTTTTNAPS